MNNLIIREGRVLLEEPISKQQLLTLKLCIGTKIYKFQNLTWNVHCKRWETPQELKVGWSLESSIQLELYYQNNGPLQVIGEGIIDMTIMSEHLNQQIKIALTYDGIMTGWLYCTMALEGEVQKQIDNKFLCIYKIGFFFLEDEDQSFKLKIFQNTLPIFEKQFTLIQKAKTIFPNLKQSIRYSDVISLSILHPKKQFRNISFLVDNIKRGRTTNFQSWIRNKHNNKTGDLKLQYFLQNLFLQNERKVVSRKGLFNATYSAQEKVLKSSDIHNVQDNSTKPTSKEHLMNTKNYEENEEENEMMIRIKKTEEKQKPKPNKDNKELQKRGSKRAPVQHYTQQLKKNQNTIPCLRQSKTNFAVSKPKVLQKPDKKQFYFQSPLDS